MILGMEIALLVLGIMILVKGKLTLNKKCVVEGKAARRLAVIAFLPMAVSIAIGIVMACIYASKGRHLSSITLRWTITGIEFGMVISCVVLIYAVASKLGRAPTQKPRADVGNQKHS